jgi:PKD repeat protein
LTITNGTNQTATTTNAIIVNASGAVLTANFSFSPVDPHNNTVVSFNGSDSQPSGSITNYRWDFGDNTAVVNSASPTTTHQFTVTVTTTFVVRLTVTDNAGRTATITRNVQVLFP